jgi:hypothetical protein
MKLQSILEDLTKEAIQPGAAPIPYANNDGGRAAKASDTNTTYNSLKKSIDVDQELIDFLNAELPQLTIFQKAKQSRSLPRYAALVQKLILNMDPDYAKK